MKMAKLRIDEVTCKGDTYPIVVDFQTGYTTDQFQSIDAYLLEEKITGKKRAATVIDDLLYAGEEDHADPSNTLLLARNRTTGKVRLIEVGNAHLKPTIRRENELSRLHDTSALELSIKFGSKKSKQKMEQSQKLKVNIETVTAQMKNVTKTVTKEKVDLTAYLVQNSDDFYIPPINREAASVEDVYDKSKILTPEQYDKIYSEIESKDFMSEHHSIISSIVSKKSLTNKEKVLSVYASALYKMYALTSKDIVKKSFSVCNFSPTLNEIVLNNFAQMVNNRRTRSGMFKDKALCHAIVLTLLLNSYKLDIETLASSLKITPNLATAKAKATSASIVTSGGKKVIQLKLPLASNKPFRRKSTKF